MDDVYKHYNKYASSKVQIKEYFDNYSKLITSAGCYIPLKKEPNDIMSLMGVDLGDDEMSMLTNYCSVDNLTVEGEVPKMINNRKMRRKQTFDAQEPADADLKTIQNLKQRLKQENKRPSYKYQSELFVDEGKKEREDNTDRLCTAVGNNILVFVRIYHPFMQRSQNMQKKECGSQLRLNKVIAILGSQTLVQLREKISCVADYTISKECSTNLSEALGPMAKDVYKSGFFFIEDTFYNDMRCPANVDYSKVIIKWAERRPKLGPFKTALMEECRIDSLNLRFGFPWVYKHQGGCEHLVVFSNARFVNCDDEPFVSAYPKIVRLRPTASKLCMICGSHCAAWMATEHERMPHNPCYYCNDCFMSYNYVDGKKVGNFRAFALPRNIEAVKGKIPI